VQEARQKRLKDQQERAAALKDKRKKEESEKWWAGAEIFRPKTEDAPRVVNLSDEEEDKKQMLLNRYKLDYFRWNDWSPTDEASLEEIEALRAAEEATKNAEFENNNADFCKTFQDDMEQRKKNTAKKAESAEVSRLKGNRHFKNRQWERALESYMEALKEQPFDAKTVNNIAQVHIKTKEYADALEFISRTLYLEPANVKALSRKALVLGERGEVAEAIGAIKLALAVEPANADLLAQEKELVCIEREKLEEVAAMQALSILPPAPPAVENVDPNKDSSSGVVVGAEGAASVTEKQVASVGARAGSGTLSGVQLVDHLAACLAAHSTSTSASGSNSEPKQLLEAMLRATSALSADPSVRVYLRTSGTLAAAVEFAKGGCDRLEQPSAAPTAAATTAAAPEGESGEGREVKALQICLKFLALAVHQQRASKLLLVEGKLLAPVKGLLKSRPMEDLHLLEAMLQLLHALCCDDVAVKARAAIVSDKGLLCNCAAVLGNVSYKASSRGLDPSGVDRSIAAYCAKILKAAAFCETGQAALASLDAANGFAMVCGLTSGLFAATSAKTAKADWDAATEALVDAAVGLSQVESLRAHFAMDVPMSDSQFASLCSGLVAAAQGSPHFAVNCVAGLMNACLEGTNEVRRAVVKSGGLALVLPALTLSEQQRAGEDSINLVRKAGLLARLAGDAEMQQTLSEEAHYRAICRRIAIPEGATQWQLDERAHFIRVLGALSKPSAACTAVGMQENVLGALLAIFPTPKTELGEITAQSVTLLPDSMPPTALLGNAARCLMPYADSYATELYSSTTLQGVEKLVCAMASCPEIRVRRNIAILLAKGCRVPGTREKVTELRGMQMMVELQSQL